jgi:hypothetical protein
MQNINPATAQPRHSLSPNELDGRGANRPVRPPKSGRDTLPDRPAESRDDYPAVVAHLSERLRIIECRDRIQWIVQRRRSICPNSWRGVSYCRTRESLLRCAGSGDPAAMAQLRALPERFPEAPQICAEAA